MPSSAVPVLGVIPRLTWRAHKSVVFPSPLFPLTCFPPDFPRPAHPPSSAFPREPPPDLRPSLLSRPILSWASRDPMASSHFVTTATSPHWFPSGRAPLLPCCVSLLCCGTLLGPPCLPLTAPLGRPGLIPSLPPSDLTFFLRLSLHRSWMFTLAPAQGRLQHKWPADPPPPPFVLILSLKISSAPSSPLPMVLLPSSFSGSPPRVPLPQPRGRLGKPTVRPTHSFRDHGLPSFVLSMFAFVFVMVLPL